MSTYKPSHYCLSVATFRTVQTTGLTTNEAYDNKVKFKGIYNAGSNRHIWCQLKIGK